MYAHNRIIYARTLVGLQRSSRVCMSAKNDPTAGMGESVQPYTWLPMLLRKKLPVLSTIPRSGTWFLRYAVSFLGHLDRGGQVEDRITREIVGSPSGAPFDFRRFRGGPLFLTRKTMPYDHLFIGHTVCPGFAGMADDFAWWSQDAFPCSRLRLSAPGPELRLHAGRSRGLPVHVGFRSDLGACRLGRPRRAAGAGLSQSTGAGGLLLPLLHDPYKPGLQHAQRPATRQYLVSRLPVRQRAAVVR